MLVNLDYINLDYINWFIVLVIYFYFIILIGSNITMSNQSYIGAHTSITPNILAGIEYMHKLGANAIQIFTGPSQSSSLRVKQHVSEPELIKKYLFRNNIKLVIHAIYTINFCSAPATSTRIKYAQDNVIYDLELGEKIGACCVVVHIGSQGQLGLDNETAYNNMVSNINAILLATAASAPHVNLALEVPAGQGKQIASSLEELTRLWMLCIKDIDAHTRKRLGICIDTAHLFSSGHDIRNVKQFNDYLSKFNSAIGKEHILCIHLNDSKVALGARRDVHQGLGEGYLFGDGNGNGSNMSVALKVIQKLVNFAKTLAIPVILETHSAGSYDKPGGELYAQELALLKQLIGNNTHPKNWKLIHSINGNINGNIITNAKTKKQTQKQIIIPRLSTNMTKKNQHATINVTINANNISQLNYLIPTNIALINKFIRIKEFYTYVNPDKFRALAYNKAIIQLQSYPEEILQGAQVAHLPGVGAKIVEKINEWLHTGDMKIFTDAQIDIKFEEWEQSHKDNIGSILGFGPTKVQQLAKQNITTIKQLHDAVTNQTIKLSPSELVGLKYHNDLIRLVPRDETKKIFDTISDALSDTGLIKKYGLHAEIAGSWPSGKSASKDIDILLFTDKYPNADKANNKANNKADKKADKKTDKQAADKTNYIPANIMTEIQTCLQNAGILLDTVNIGTSKLMGIVHIPVGKHYARHIDIRLLPSDAEVFGRFYFTSGRVFNQIVRAHAKRNGYKLNEFGLYDLRNGGKRVTGLNSEEKIMAYIGLSYIPMAKRR